MSSTTTQAKSTAAQGRSAKIQFASKFRQAQSMGGQSARFNKAVGMHLLLFFLLGLVLGCTVFIPIFTTEAALSKWVFTGIAILSILLGAWSHSRAGHKIEWYEYGSFGAQLLLQFGVYTVLFLGIFAMYICISSFTALADVSVEMMLLFSAASMLCLLPYLLTASFEMALAIEPKQYSLWAYPENYVEKQPTWNRDRIVFANLHFKRKENESLVTTVKVKLPKEANFGELIYLFIRDYNENRSPDNPISKLSQREGVEGWIFRTNVKGAKRFLQKSRLIDTNKTVEENGIEEEQHLYFERVIRDEA